MSNLVNLATKEIIRADMLEICRQSIPFGADEKVIKAALRKSGHQLTEPQVKEQLYYLEGKKLIELQSLKNRTLGIERLIARITPEGMDVLEGNQEITGLEAGE